ncbi:MAG: hypothetical protein KGY75_03080 [Candidatus Cloacimonetes bacterium]|nr:hypothetical protein [Candidatus Cloacimonadota bacterium]MBS3767091.1 hypothetical protein [Candidatus Cloacimonadota bacterium]
MKKLITLGISLFIVGCSIFRAPVSRREPEIKKQLMDQLEMYHQFKAIGIVNLSLKNLEMKSNFVLIKKENKLRFDVLEGGLLGLSPTPKAQVLNRDSLQIFIPHNNVVHQAEALNFFSENYVQRISNAEIKQEENNKYSVLIEGDLKIILNRKNLHIHKIIFGDFALEFLKYKKKFPRTIDVFKNNNLVLKMSFEKWSFEKISDDIFVVDYPEDVLKNKVSLEQVFSKGEINWK